MTTTSISPQYSLENIPLLLSYWLVNTSIVFFLHLRFPSFIVLGNNKLTDLGAALIVGCIMMMVQSLTVPLGKRIGVRHTHPYYWAGVFVVVDTISLWILSRMAGNTGFGIVGFWWAIVVGILFGMAHWILWKFFAK